MALLERNIARRHAEREPTALRILPGGRSARP